MLADSASNSTVTAKLFSNPALWMGLGLCLIILVPIVSIAPWLQTFIHTWRPELASSLVALGFVFWASRRKDFFEHIRSVGSIELFGVLLPCLVFILWSLVSLFYANSARSAFHHTMVWAVYLIFYILVRFLSETGPNTKILIFAVIASIWMICFPAVFEYYTMVSAQGGTTIGIRYSKYAEMMNTLFPVIALFSLRLKGKAFWFGLATVTLMWLFVIGSLSRTSTGLFLVGSVLLAAAIFGLKRLRLFRKRFLVMAVFLAATPVLLHAPSFFTSNGVLLVERMKDEATAESNNVRPLFSMIALEMFKSKPLTGVGADNYGQEFTAYRGRYAAANPADPNLAIVEAEMPERAHNEFSQIGAELGLPGLAIISWFLVGIAVILIFALLHRKKIGFLTVGGIIGILLFLASSLVTSYSFRIPQNGLVFFFVLALTVSGVFPVRAINKPSGKTDLLWPLRLGFAAAALCCAGLAAFSVARAVSVVYGIRGADAASYEASARAFDISFSLDKENGSNYFARGMYLFRNEKFAEAIPYLRKAIDLGRSTSIEYSYLASAQILSGDKDAALKTLSEAVGIYPVSTFLLTRYAVLLSDTGKSDEAAGQFAKTRGINERQAETWRNLIEHGAVSASKTAFDEKKLAVMDLKPKAAIYAIIAEREVLHPEERFNAPSGEKVGR